MAWAAERTPRGWEPGAEAVARGPAGRFQPNNALQLTASSVRSAPLPVEELLHIEHRSAFEHVIDRPRSFMREDGERFARPMFVLQAGEIVLARRMVTEEQYRRC